MKVIGAGLPRTATLSQHAAMEILGFKPVYHMATVFEKGQAPEWARGGSTASAAPPNCWRTMRRRSTGQARTTPRISPRAYPDAKIVLSERDPRVLGSEHGQDDLGAVLRRQP